jgi:ubiquinone/menaquinone biosynthesis C-methylase UbiE
LPTPETVQFGALAPRYDELRPADRYWREAFDLFVEEADLRGQRVLDVGCGTGRLVAELAALGSRVWGIDPSAEMLAVARAKVRPGTGLRAGRAEELAFKDRWFDRVVMELVVHLVDRPRAFAEARRVLVPGGRLAVWTFDPDGFARGYLAGLFPSLLEIDLARFPSGETLVRELGTAGFADVRLVPLVQQVEQTRAQVLRKLEGRFVSTLHLLDEDEFAAGLERAERTLPDPVRSERRVFFAIAA